MFLMECRRLLLLFFFFFKQKTAYEMRISDWSSDVCSSDLAFAVVASAVVVLLREDLHGRAHRAEQPFRHFGLLVERAQAEVATLVDQLLGVLELDVAEARHRRLEECRSEERRVGKEGVRTCRSRRCPKH